MNRADNEWVVGVNRADNEWVVGVNRADMESAPTETTFGLALP